MLKTYRRLDVLDFELSKVERTDEGYANFYARATRTGVFKYRNKDGSIRRELRPPSEVFNTDSMKTLENKPVTNDHPSDLLNTENTREYIVGVTGNEVKRDGIYLKTKAIIMDKASIDDIIKKGKVQVSCGYSCEHDLTPGVYDGEEYDLVQTNIRYNHVAIVDLGRAGPEVKITLDSQDAIMVQDAEYEEKESLIEDVKESLDVKIKEDRSMKYQKEDNKMVKITIDGIDQEVSEEFKKAFDSNKESQKLNHSYEAKVSELQAQVDSLKDKLSKEDAEEKKIKSDAEINQRVNERISLYSAAKKHCDDSVCLKLDAMSDMEIKIAVIKSIKKDAISLEDKDLHYINARFDCVIEDSVLNIDSEKDIAIGNAIIGNRNLNLDSRKNQDIKMNNWKNPSDMTKKTLSKA